MSFTVMIDPLVILLANARLWYNGSKCCLVLQQSTAVDPKHAWGLQCKFVHGTCNSQLNLPRATTWSSLSSDQQQQSILEKKVCSYSDEHSDTYTARMSALGYRDTSSLLWGQNFVAAISRDTTSELMNTVGRYILQADRCVQEMKLYVRDIRIRVAV